jgi:hypothetical protein
VFPKHHKTSCLCTFTYQLRGFPVNLSPILSPQRDFVLVAVWRGRLRVNFCNFLLAWKWAKLCFHVASYCSAHFQPLICVCSHIERPHTCIVSFKEHCSRAKNKPVCYSASVYFPFGAFWNIKGCRSFCNLIPALNVYPHEECCVFLTTGALPFHKNSILHTCFKIVRLLIRHF